MSILQKVYMHTIARGRFDIGTGNGMDIWQWDEGVAMYGLTKAFEMTGDEEIIKFMKEWIDYQLDREQFGVSINTTAPLLGVLKLLESEPNNQRYLKLCKKFADWCLSEAPRADLGTFEHSCTVNKYPNQIWADTLFMGCLFLVKWGLFTGEQLYINEAMRQFILHYKFLQDEKTGLIVHGYDCNIRQKMGVLWGRGNCWLSVASVEVLTLLDENTKGYEEVKKIFLNHIRGVLNFQHESGAWHTVMDRKDTYLEMSATAAFAYAIAKAVRLGYISESYRAQAEKAFMALESDIDSQGEVVHGSIGTCVMDDYRAYNSVGFGFSYFTQGLAMMALAEKLAM